jgi:hypothetical protein
MYESDSHEHRIRRNESEENEQTERERERQARERHTVFYSEDLIDEALVRELAEEGREEVHLAIDQDQLIDLRLAGRPPQVLRHPPEEVPHDLVEGVRGMEIVRNISIDIKIV